MELEGWEIFRGKYVKVVCKDTDKDGKRTVSIKLGFLKNIDDFFVYLLTNGKNTAIPKNIILRIDEVGS